MKQQRLVLEDYEKILELINKTEAWMQDVKYSDIYNKLKNKIDDLENPKPRKKADRAKYICEKCDHKFKRVVAKCPKCEDTNIKKLDDYFEEE